MTDTETQINALMKRYNELTGFNLQHRGICNPRGPAWQRFMGAGLTIQDLETVIVWLKGQIRVGERRIGCLRFHNLIEDHHLFEEELGMAKAEKRNVKPAPTPKDNAIAQLRPGAAAPKGDGKSAKPIGDWIKDLKKAAGGNEL